jgi:hypothetical protein
MARKLTHGEFASRISGEFEILDRYVSNKTRIKVRHKICGYEWEPLPMNLMKDAGCPVCKGKNLKKTTKQFRAEVEALVGDAFQVVGEYTGNHEKIEMLETATGKPYFVTPAGFLAGDRPRKEAAPKLKFGAERPIVGIGYNSYRNDYTDIRIMAALRDGKELDDTPEDDDEPEFKPKRDGVTKSQFRRDMKRLLGT